jgi:hypothetical protein
MKEKMNSYQSSFLLEFQSIFMKNYKLYKTKKFFPLTELFPMIISVDA